MFGFIDDDRGFFGNLFDINRDGKLDSLERAVDFSLFMKMMEEDETDDYDVNEYEDDEW